MMQWGDYIALAIGLVIAIIATTYLMINQKNKVIEWLKYAVSEAEKQLGGGTGQLKLRLVYDWFVQKFPVIAAVVPFRVFSAWVDVALGTFKKWLEDNRNVKNYVGGEQQ